jgi:ABC-type transport system involved in multi-copper enzyme maturation permease subunit
VSALARIAAIAENTAREAVRDKLLYNLLMFAGLMILSSVLLAQLQMGYDARIYNDVGLAAIAFFGVLIAIFVGINLVYREMSLKTVYAMLAKPLHRWEFLLGKYLGLLGMLALEVAIMSSFFFVLLWFKASEIHAGMGWAILLIFFELALVTAIALFFSSFTTPYLSGMFTVALWIAGHLLADLRAFGQGPDAEAIRPITEFLYWFLPNLDRLDIKGPAASGEAIEVARVMGSALYATLYSAVLMLLAIVVFRKRDFR